MRKFKISKLFLILTAVLFLGLFITIFFKNLPAQKILKVAQSLPPTPIEKPFTIYTQPKIPRKDFYRIVMVGDSMTEALGVHGGKLSEDLNSLFQSTPGHQRILIDNYAKGGTNIMELFDEMTSKDNPFPPLLSSQFDMILIESCGYNPLSQYGLTEGLKKQTETLDSLMKLLLKTHPDAVIVFVATIAPNKETYALQEVSQSSSSRAAEAQERIEYLKNHIAYASSHNIPIIDIYGKSLLPNGSGNPTYINPTDNIHPSSMGLDFIDSEIANYIYNSKILPQ